MKMIHAVVCYRNPSTPRTVVEFNEPYDENMSVREYVDAFTERVRKDDEVYRIEVMRMQVDGELIYLSAGPE
ncbi:MAG: hypothetical protein QM762_13410 [Chryseolinea sp.]